MLSIYDVLEVAKYNKAIKFIWIGEIGTDENKYLFTASKEYAYLLGDDVLAFEVQHWGIDKTSVLQIFIKKIGAKDERENVSADAVGTEIATIQG